MTGLVHCITDWSVPTAEERTVCGRPTEELPEEDVVLSEGKHPREYGGGRELCPGCYPESHAGRRP